MRGDLDDFVACWEKREESERFRSFGIDELLARDKLNLDLFWLRDDNLQVALESFAEVSEALAGVAEGGVADS